MSDPKWPNSPYQPYPPSGQPGDAGAPAPSGAAAPGPYGQPQQPANPWAAQQPQQPANPWAAQQPQQPANPWAAQQPQPPPYGAPQQPPFGMPANPYAQQQGGFPGPVYPPMPRGNSVFAGVLLRVGLGVLMAAGGGAYSFFVQRRANNAATQAYNPAFATTSASTAPADPAAQLGEKLDQYIDHCLNRFSGAASRSHERYLMWADEANGPTGHEQNVYGLYELNGDPSDCARAVSAAAAMPPASPQLEAAAQGYAVALQTLAPLVEQANQYYQRQNYRDDGMARGRQMHAPLMAAFQGFFAADRALVSQLEPLQDQVNDAEIARVQNDPSRRLVFLVRTNQRNARQLMRAVDQLEIGPDRKLHGVDAAQFVGMVDALEHGNDEMVQFARSHADQSGVLHTYSFYESQSNDFVIAARALARRLRDGTAFTPGEMEEMSRWHRDLDGTPRKVLSEYNDLVSRHNSLW